MKKSFLLLGLIFALSTLVSHAQIYEYFYQDFETGTPVNYALSSTTSIGTQNTIVSGGQRAIKMTWTQNSADTITLDTIDFSAMDMNFYTLEFMHIAYVDPTAGGVGGNQMVCYIEAKIPTRATWITLNSTHYNMDEGGSTEFNSLATFNKYSYTEWQHATAVSNQLWKKERFDLDQLLQTLDVTDKKVVLRFVLVPRNNASVPAHAWYIDDIRVRASRQPIVTPNITMLSFPDHLNYPSSRGAKLKLYATTQPRVTQGINGDSIYAEYRVGNNPTVYRAYLHRAGPNNLFEGRIPFFGYDTLIHYHIIVKDSTTNNNSAYFPKNSSQWLTFRCVRGRSNYVGPSGTTTNNSVFPFPVYADNKSEFIYDSVTMAGLGYGPGYITDFRFIITAMGVLAPRERFQIRMANMDNSVTRIDNQTYTSSAMQIVYDSVFTIMPSAPNTYMNVHLQDTFFYSGSDLVVQVIYDALHNVQATAIKHIPTPNNKRSLYSDVADAYLGYDPFTNENFESGETTTTRPWLQFMATKNLPLMSDCGVSSLIYPSFTTPCHIGTDSVVVWLKNYGVYSLSAVRLWYRIDNQPPVYYDWTGLLAGGDSVRVHLNDNQMFTVGYHTIRAWVDDTVTLNHNQSRVRDHEPYNDTVFAPFAACDGPYSGERTVGTGSGAHFSTLENCLYVLSRCGVDGPLTIKLPAGTYGVTKFPYIPGTSETNLVTFEPATATGQVTFRRPRQGVTTNEPMLVDMTEASGIRFNRINFNNGRYTDNRCDVLVQLGDNSSNCVFENCTFSDSNTITASAQAMLHTGEGDSVTVRNCTFYGGIIGIDVRGTAPDIRSVDNVVQFNTFTNQVNTAISVVNQDHVIVDSNYVNDVRTNASYTILGQYIYNGSRITRNKVYSTKGSSCIGVSDMHGNEQNYCIVANNMLVSVFDGTTNMLTTPLNIIKGSYMKVVFNSVRMNAPQFVNVAGATLGGDIISNSYFQNNVIAVFDTSNYAFNFMPGNNSATLHVDHNCYYSVSGVLNKLTGISYHNINAWRNALPSDVGSVTGNPNYTNGSRIDLRSFNALLRNVGVPIAEVPIDMFGSIRNATAPSLGAYEVTALSIDFTPVEFVTPLEDYCGAPASIPVEVVIRNTGNGSYISSDNPNHPITVYYSIDNGPVQSFTVNRNIGPNDSIHFLSTRTMSLPSGAGNSDRTYEIKWWVKCSLDPDDLNDTSVYTVISRYAAPAPAVINQNVAYNSSASIFPSVGINLWPISYYTSGNGRQQRSGISWYHSMDDTAKFYYGPVLYTTPLYADTTFYISQKRNLPLVKITEVQVNRTNPGATNPMPSWMNASTTFAVELTNCGDYPANVEGDSIIVLQSNAAGKIWVLPNVTIQPGENLVLQFRTSSTASDSTRTIYAPSTAVVTPAYTANFAVVYRDGHGVADAVPFNNVITAATTQPINWAGQGVPAAVWQGSAINLAQGASTAVPPVNTPTAGARRIAWPTNSTSGSPTATATLWQVATDSLKMRIGTTENNLILYYDNGCEGARAAVNIHVTNIPVTDLAVDEPEVNEGCNLTTTEPVTVWVHNYGIQNVSSVVLKYSLDGGATVACADTLATGLAAHANVHHTFSNTINMHAGDDTTFNIKVWVEAVSSDPNRFNDTSSAQFFSSFTPEPPIVTSPQSVDYGERLLLTAGGLPSNVYAAWFSANHTPYDTTAGTFLSPYIYHPDTFFVKSIALRDVAETHVGTLASIMSNNYPSPYNPKTRYVKEQYLYTAEQIQAAGHGAGNISSLSFSLATLGNNVNSFTFDYYTIKMGTVTQSVFANGNFVTGLSQVYNSNNLTLTSDDIGWVHHTLDTPFQWDGTSNIVIEITRALSTAGISAGANTHYTAQANTVISKQHASTDQATQTSGSKGNNRPDIIFGFLEPVGCESAEEAILINVTNVPNVDATIEWPESLDTMSLTSCDTIHYYVKLTNRGYNNINDYTLRYKIDNGAWQQTTGSANNLPLGYSRILPLFDQLLVPGRHTITAVILVAGDSIVTNDTITRTVNVRFCGGEYVVGTCPSHDYPSLTVAIDTLVNAGIAGPVTFQLCEQTFNEQLTLGYVEGASPANTITFTTVPGATSRALITHTPTNASNYVMRFISANYVTFNNVDFYANYTTGSGNNVFANVLKLDGCSNIHITNATIRSKKTTASSTNANLVLLGDENYYITIDYCLLDSGYYAVRSVDNAKSHNITISNNDILNFWYQGVHIRNTDTLFVTRDSIAAGSSLAGKPLTGVYVANGNHVHVHNNFIYLVDNKTGGKRGISINNCKGTNIDRVTVYNNMISLSGSAVASLASSGIWVDSLSKHVSVYFNTVSLYAGASQPTTRSFSCQNSSAVHVLNNIFYNGSKGYAYYVAIDTCVSNSNFNVYYSNAEPHPTTGARKFARWGASDCVDIDSLRVINNKDPNSLEEFPYFAGVTNLSLTLAQFADRAQYNPDVTDDVFGNIRPQIPAPTIGAHEFTRLTHNITIAAIIDPVMPAITTGNNPDVYNIETDSITVRVYIYNNGNAPENNVTWYAYLGDVSPTVQSVTNTINRLPLRTLYEDSVKVPSPLGIIDTQYMVVSCSLAPGVTDDRPDDNVDTAAFFIYPAYDLQLVSVAVDSTVDPLHCRMYQVPLRYTVRNVGKKDIPADHQIMLGYDYYCHQPSTQSFPNFPGSNNSDIQPIGALFPVGTMLEYVNSPANQPNLYPTGYIGDITVRLRGFVHHEYDIKPLTDTTNYINITSNHTPEMPIPHDTMVDYGTYGNLWATQNANRTIRWHRDTVSGDFFYNGNNNYGRSTHWSNTPQYFHDSLYYLSCLSTRNCTSYYSAINVGINPPLYYDVSISEVRSPRGSGRVYLEKDTVTLRVVNYGSQPISNIPIAFKFMNANGRVTYLEVHDTVRATIPGRVGDNVSYFDFSFDTALLDINQPLTNTTFTLNAWVYHPDDMQRGNDTLRTVHTFRSLAENIYDTINSMAPPSVEGFNITRVSFNELDNIMPDMIGYDNLWLGSYNANQAEIPTLFVRRGTVDTLTVEVANSYNEMDSSTAASLCVCIDYNRDGVYDFNGPENILKSTFSSGVKTRSRREYKKPFTIPEDAHYGYMRMLVWVLDDSTAYVAGNHSSSAHRDLGQMQQYLLYVQEDCMLDSVDAALTRVVSPRNHIVTAANHYVEVMLANKGLEPLTSAQINYSFDDHLNVPQTGTISWTGNLEPGMSEVVRLDSINFYEGTTDLVCTVEVEGDTFHVNNNTLLYQYHRYYVVRPRFIDSFDVPVNKWYAPAGYNAFTRNYFERGIPAKSTIVSAYSQPNALVTSCTESVVTGRHGNRSVVYTPIIDIRTIKCDTIHFLLSKNMAEGSYMQMEFKDFQGNWIVVDDGNVRWGVDSSFSWYDNRFGWTGNTINGAYVSKEMATKPLSGDFPQDLQFRFVYTTPVTTSPAANFGDGAAIDNFKIGRAQRDIDVGVTEITHPTAPQFGQTIYPRVIIHNYGYDTISHFVVSYKPYGTYLAMESICDQVVYPGGDIEYEFPDPFVITNAFPDTFDICAFTNVQRDLYKDNDTACGIYGLAPLANDLYMYQIVSPLSSAVAGDSLDITVRLRNFGQNEIDECDLFYVYNNGDTVHEHVVFNDYLGRNLASTEFFNYTFTHRVRATMGSMLLRTWCTYRYDVYPYNDTLFRQIAAISALTDVQATAAYVDKRDMETFYAAVIIDNVGARMANDFKVGFWYDNDPNTLIEEVFHREGGLPYGAHVVHTFRTPLPGRSAVYDLVTGYVSVDGDTNQTNDTTRVNLTDIVKTMVDLDVMHVEIEENRSDSCRVRVVVKNVGSFPYTRNLLIKPLINGQRTNYQTLVGQWYIDVGDIKHIDIMKSGNYWKIPKDPNRKYVGSCAIENIWDDNNPANDQTTIIKVINYFEGVPISDNDDFVLDQNYPNPYDGSTRIEFNLPFSGTARFFVNDVVGRQVYEHTEYYRQGRNSITFKKGNLPAGIYYYGVEYDGQRRMHKMIIK